MTSVPYALLRSAIPDSDHRTELRIDPVHDGLFATSSSAIWNSRKLLAKRLASGAIGKPPALLRADPESAWAARQDTMWWQRRLDVLSCLTQWCVLTIQQIAAFTGHPIGGVSRVLGELFAMDLIECGMTVHPSQSTTHALRRSSLWRTTSDREAWRRLRTMMTGVEQLSVTGGSPSNASHLYDRHNVITAEFALRLAEFGRPAALLGDTLSHARLLTALDGRPVALAHAQTQADMTIVRADGLRIAVEMTVNVNRSFATKARSWARLMQMHPLVETGLVVLFLVAPAAEGSHTSIGSTEATVRKHIRAATAEYRGTTGNPTAARMFVARWDDYFPESGQVDPQSLTKLHASSPTGTPADADPSNWEQRALMNVEFAPTTPLDPTAVIRNTRGIRATPHWMREGEHTDLSRVLLTAGGFRAGVPQLRTAVLGRERQPSGRGFGPVGDALTPARLQF
ncbi:hypothetical protein [Microbacterium enclense]|uniref:hypothetical protein n=1 Tax=Microbacterium enclense TaxID=993073 RepID=UPI003F7CE5A6